MRYTCTCVLPESLYELVDLMGSIFGLIIHALGKQCQTELETQNITWVFKLFFFTILLEKKIRKVKNKSFCGFLRKLMHTKKLMHSGALRQTIKLMWPNRGLPVQDDKGSCISLTNNLNKMKKKKVNNKDLESS